jgi:uncharacterized protein YfaS (alpha-2-macroglobulin family)
MKMWLLSLAALVGTTALILTASRSAQAAGETAAVTYSHGAVHLTLPYHAPHAGSGQLVAEVVNPEDEVLGRAEQHVDLANRKGSWNVELSLAKALPIDDLVWHRVRYRFSYSGEVTPALQGTESISEILRMPVIHILGQQSYLTGSQAAIRVIVTDSNNETIAGPSSLRIELAMPGPRTVALFSGRLNAHGTTEAQFRFPTNVTGAYPLRYMVETPIGSTEFTQQVRLEDKASILLTTEKPIYQPGQAIHVRALALDRSRHEAETGRSLTFELEDSRGNKIFKRATQTDKFGIASAVFGLADEVNLGTYHLRALMGANTAEIALNVDRYVLPKFKVAVEFSGSDHKAKRGYRPGDHVTGTVRANYFFGKPVDGGGVTVKASGMDVAQFEAGSVQGRTDGEGAYRFDLKLPAYFAGRPLESGVARVLVEATVKDSAGHAETRGQPITVSESPLIVTAVPEGGTLIPNLENQVFILTSYADGTPCPAEIRAEGQTVTTDTGGIAVIRIKAGEQGETLAVEAWDKEGNRASRSIQLDARQGEDQILLRTDRAVYRAGDRIHVTVFSTKSRGSAYVDVVKNGQTVLTRDLDIAAGKAEFVLTATGNMAGTLDFSAYQFGRNARADGNHRLVFVQPADELKIEAAADGRVYKPGDEARIRFRVTNSRGDGVQAALGLQVVDEAVFALAEKQPGFAKVFFYLEQEALKPRYEIHSIGMPEIVEPVESAKVLQRDRAARALFAATEVVRANKFETEFGRTVPWAKYGEYSERYRARFLAQLRGLAPRDLVGSDRPDVRDAWDTKLRHEPATWDRQKRYYLVHSAGPDKRFDTGDDLETTVEIRTRRVPDPNGSTIRVSIEHDRGPFNGLAEIAGWVFDETAPPGATVKVRNVATGNARTLTTGVYGGFHLGGISPGRYVIEISTAGLQITSREVTLAARDRANITTTQTFTPGEEQVVIVDAMPRRIRVGGAVFHAIVNGAPVAVVNGVAVDVAGGVIGGVVGGVPGGIRQFDAAMLVAPKSVSTATLAKDQAAPAAPRVRAYFPEALYINPEIITDQDGRATITIPLADSITTWRMAMLASTPRGALGSGSSSIKVFQDFFTDLDLPVTLTQGDRVSIPVAVYNYSGERGNVNLQLKAADWYSLVEDNPAKIVSVESGRVGASQFTLEAKQIGKFKLTLAARMRGEIDRADIVVREIEVIPNGREQNLVLNGRLETAVQQELKFPSTSIADASKIFVRLYPGPLSQVIEGMDSILRMPNGCFEQTSSSTYPNVLALDYMKRTKKLTPEVHAKAEGFISNGYQRLLTFEVPGGGFSWFGNAPANKILTAYGLMEFYDMSKVYSVDPRLIQRTQQWLAAQQQADGGWKPDASFINEGATNRYNSDVLRITAYIAWALEDTGYQGPAIEKARQFIASRMGAKLDAYTLAVLANFAAGHAKDHDFTQQVMQSLLDARTERDDQAWWTAEQTSVYGGGASASVETTGLAVQALLKWGRASATARKALNYITAKKDASGAWGSTQATILALQALLVASEKSAADVRGTVEISLNGKPVERLVLTPDNNDLFHQFVYKEVDSSGANTVSIRFDGKGGLAYQLVGRYFVPWTEQLMGEPLSIAVNYDRTRLAQNDVATATATVKNNLPKAANMVMVDLGIPPGFDLLSEDLQDYQEKSAARKSGRLEKFSLTATQAILYFDSIAPGDTVTLRYRLRAKYPIRARTFLSRVYEYYDPDVNSVARPAQLEIRARH